MLRSLRAPSSPLLRSLSVVRWSSSIFPTEDADQSILKTSHASSNQVAEALEICCQQLKDNNTVVPDRSSTIAFFWTGKNRMGKQLRGIPEKLQEEGICPAHRVFGATKFDDIMGINKSFKDVSLSITVLHIPGAAFNQFHVEPDNFPRLAFQDKEETSEHEEVQNKDKEEASSSKEANSKLLDNLVLDMDKKRFLLMMINGKTINESRFLPQLDVLFPSVPKFGAIAYPAKKKEDPMLMCVNGTYHTTGAAGVLMEGALDVEFISSRGYLPIGSPFTITGLGNQEIIALDGVASDEAIDSRLEHMGFIPSETPVLFQILSKPAVDGTPLRMNNVTTVNETYKVDGAVQIGDSVQFFAYDYRRVIPDVGKQVKDIANKDDVKLAVAFSSLLDPNELHHSTPKAKESSDNAILVLPGARKIAPTVKENVVKANKSDLAVDMDLYPSSEDMKQELERILISAHSIPNLMGSTATKIFFSTKQSAETISSPAAACIAFIKPTIPHVEKNSISEDQKKE